MDDQHGLQNISSHAQIRSVTPSSFLHQHHMPQQPVYETNNQQQNKKQMFNTQSHLQQPWNHNSSMVMPQNYPLSTPQFINIHQATPSEDRLIQHSPIIQQLGTTSISSPQSCTEHQSQQIAHKGGHFLQTSKNYLPVPSPHHQHVRQRSQIDIVQTSQVQQCATPRNGLHSIQENPTAIPYHETERSRTLNNVNVHNVQQQQYIHGLTGHPTIGIPMQQPTRRQTSSLANMPTILSTNSLHHQRIPIHQNMLMTGQIAQPALVSSTVHSSPYVGSQHFAISVIGDSQNSPKAKYRNLKKKFKYLVYENEYYQEELRNLQRKLLKLSRDKNFLLDRLGQYENISESEDSDSSVKTLDDQRTQKPQKRKQKQTLGRKKAVNTIATHLSSCKSTASIKTTKKKEKVKTNPEKCLQYENAEISEDRDDEVNNDKGESANIDLEKFQKTNSDCEHLQNYGKQKYILEMKTDKIMDVVDNKRVAGTTNTALNTVINDCDRNEKTQI